MGLSDGGLGIADVLALQDKDGNGDGMFGGNGMMMMMFLFFILAMGGNGFGGFGGNRDTMLNGALTRSDLCESFNFNNLENGVRGIQNGICDSTYALNSSILNGFHGVDTSLCAGFNGINNGINQARFDAQQCCCETNRNIDAVRYENSKNTCDIVTAGNMNTRDLLEANNCGVQRILDFMTNDKIDSLRTELQAAQLALSNSAQTQNLVNELRPCAKPAYITCSPYTTMNNGYGYGYNGNGCGPCC